jgi:predicted nuclease of predicted toxin-antitoxin system
VRIYLDQMFRAELGERLRLAGHDVVRASEAGQARADDALILDRAVREERILVTLDEHFGDWVVLPLSEHFGVVRVKAHPPTTESVMKVLLPLLSNRTQAEFRNRLVIVSANRARWIRTTAD